MLISTVELEWPANARNVLNATLSISRHRVGQTVCAKMTSRYFWRCGGTGLCTHLMRSAERSAFALAIPIADTRSDMLEFSTTRYLDTIFNFWRSLTTNPEETKKVKVQVTREKFFH